jgi:hypothetical protein
MAIRMQYYEPMDQSLGFLLWRKFDSISFLIVLYTNIIRFVKAQRLNWLDHIERMSKERVVKQINNRKPIASRPIGRPKNRWDDDVRNDKNYEGQ